MPSKFKTPFNFIDNYVTNSGSHTIDLTKMKKTGEKKIDIGYEYDYSQITDDKGDRQLVISGRTNVYQRIQSYKEDVNIYKILEKYTGGDLSVIDKNKGFYVDCTKIPKDYNEYHNRILEGQRIFDSLPIDFKEEFGKNVNQFMNSIFDRTFEKRYEDYVSRKNNSRLHNSNIASSVVLDDRDMGKSSQVVNNIDKGGNSNDN